MVEPETAENDRELSRSLRYRRGRWWRDESVVTALLLLLVCVLAIFSGACLVVFTYAMLGSGA